MDDATQMVEMLKFAGVAPGEISTLDSKYGTSIKTPAGYINVWVNCPADGSYVYVVIDGVITQCFQEQSRFAKAVAFYHDHT